MNVGHKILYKLWMGITVERRFIYPDIISRQSKSSIRFQEIEIGEKDAMCQDMLHIFCYSGDAIIQ